VIKLRFSCALNCAARETRASGKTKNIESREQRLQGIMGYSIIFRDKTRTESVTKATSPGLKQDTYPTTDVSIPTDTELGTQLTATGKIFGHWVNFPAW
jgi:hypothetical protein